VNSRVAEDSEDREEDRDMRTHAEKAAAFRALHDEPGTFIIPNPWDAGTARLLAGLGFKALATTSLGLANIHGRGYVSADEIIENARMIAAATDLPTNGDLENCGADEPKEAARLIPRACEAGLAGGSIEDFTGDPTNPIYGFNLGRARPRRGRGGEAAAGSVCADCTRRAADSRQHRPRRDNPPAADI
jgi:hypothetical protein